MDNQDTLFNQIKSAAENAETKDFPNMENVWSRVEGKLDKKVLKKENKLWKKIAVAASILLVGSVGYQIFKTEEELKTLPQNTIVKEDSTKLLDPKLIEKQNATVSNDAQNPIIKKEAKAILEKQIATENQVVQNDEAAKLLESTVPQESNKNLSNVATSNAAPSLLSNRKFESRGVAYKDEPKANSGIGYNITTAKQLPEKKLDPILVVDDKISKESVSNLDEDQLDSLIELPNPIYYINGILYSEQELFGPNPTSPYAPLNKQDIETISILQPEKAVTLYGKKGENGVVIVTTKNGKPKVKKTE